jgi:cytochrome c556
VLTAAVSWAEVAVPLAAAAIGGACVFAASRHLRRQELYVEAAQKISDYLDEAAEALKEMDAKEFDAEKAELALRAVNSAVFHSRRLESAEATERLRVAQSALWDLMDSEERRGRLWVNRAMDDAMDAVVEFMILPRLWPPRRKLRVLPPNRFPNSVDAYAA